MKVFDSGPQDAIKPARFSSSWTTSLLPWGFIRLAALALPVVAGSISNIWGETSFGAGLGAFIGICAFLMIGYGEARRQVRPGAAFAHIAVTHAAAGAVVLALPPVWQPGSGHPPLPAAIVVVPWVFLSILPSLLGGFMAVVFPLHRPSVPGQISPRLTLADGFLLLGGQICGFFLFTGKGIPSMFVAGLAGLLIAYALLRIKDRRWFLLLPLVVAGKLMIFRIIFRPAALERAVAAGNTAKVQQLIRQGANVNTKDREGNTPLFEALKRGDDAAAKVLLEAGADPNIHPEFWADSLTMAIGRKDVAMTKLLLDHGADPNIRGSDSNTPLMVAITYHQKEIVQLLLDHGADVNAKTSWGTSPLYTAKIVRDDEIGALLRAHGAK